MHLATLIPDWNSLDSVRLAHSELELLAIAFFALLVAFDILAHFAEDKKARERLFERIGLGCFAIAIVFEIAAYIYGQRNDSLSEQLIDSLSRKAGQAFDRASDANQLAQNASANAETANDIAGEAVTRAANARREAEIAENVISARRVRDEQGLETDLAKEFKGKSIAFKSYAAISDDEPFWLCSQLVTIAKRAGVLAEDNCATEPIPQIPVVDLLITAPTHEEAFRLIRILKKPLRVPGIFVSSNEGPQLTVLVGVKEDFPLWPDTHNGKAKGKSKR